MTTNRRFIAGVILALGSSSLMVLAARAADDPLNAFPTPERNVEQRVQELTDAQLKSIEVPKDGDQVVLTIAKGPRDKKDTEAVEAKPLLQVYADGRIDCGSEHEPKAERRTDKLKLPELQWLLHLAVNECRLLTQNTNDIEAELSALRKKQQSSPGAGKLPVPPGLTDYYHYHVNLPAGQNDLLLPELTLMLRPLRSRMNLGPFASLNKYARFLVARAYLGNEQQRQAILDEVNAKLKEEDPNLPAFQTEHLAGAGPMQGNFFVEFDHEVDLGNNQFQKIVGILIRKKNGEPIVSVTTTKYTKQ